MRETLAARGPMIVVLGELVTQGLVTLGVSDSTATATAVLTTVAMGMTGSITSAIQTFNLLQLLVVDPDSWVLAP